MTVKLTPFWLSKMTGIDEKEIQSLPDDISKITADKAESLIKYVQEQIDRIASRFEKKIK